MFECGSSLHAQGRLTASGAAHSTRAHEFAWIPNLWARPLSSAKFNKIDKGVAFTWFSVEAALMHRPDWLRAGLRIQHVHMRLRGFQICERARSQAPNSSATSTVTGEVPAAQQTNTCACSCAENVLYRPEDPGALDVEDGVPPPRAAPALLRRVVLSQTPATHTRCCSSVPRHPAWGMPL